MAPRSSIVLLATLSVVAAGLTGGGAPADARGRDPAAGGDPVVAWTRQFGTGGADWAHGVAVGASGAAYVVGDTNGGFPGQTGGGSYDAFIRKYAPGGTVVWTRQFGSDEVDLASGVAVDSSGAVFVVGATDGRLPGQLDRGDRDAFIRKYAPGGAVLWTRQFGTGEFDAATAVAVDASGCAYVVGTTSGAFPGQPDKELEDAFVRKYAPGGAVLWTRQFGTHQRDVAETVAVHASGTVHVVGETYGTFAGQSHEGSQDAFVRNTLPGEPSCGPASSGPASGMSPSEWPSTPREPPMSRAIPTDRSPVSPT